MDMVDKVISWSGEADPKTVDKWLEFARWYMERWDWNEAAIKDWLEWGEHGFNNTLFHAKTDVGDFFAEVNYCSDRMSIDRLLRCHVAYRTLK